MLTKSARTLIDIAIGYILLIPATIFYFYGTADNVLIYVTFLITLDLQ